MPSRPLLLGTASGLLVGFLVGYALRPPAATPPSHAASTSVSAATQPAQPKPPTGSIAASDTAPATATTTPGQPTFTLRERLEVLRWLQSIDVRVTRPLMAGTEVDPALRQILGLSDSTADRIAALHGNTGNAIRTQREAMATSALSPDGKELLIDLPPLTAEQSRAHYDEFNRMLNDLLDADQRTLFNTVAAESSDLLFDRFGLNSVRYEVTLQPTSLAGGKLIFSYRRKFVDAAGTTYGHSGSQQTLDNIKKSDPIIARFLTVREQRP